MSIISKLELRHRYFIFPITDQVQWKWRISREGWFKLNKLFFLSRTLEKEKGMTTVSSRLTCGNFSFCCYITSPSKNYLENLKSIMIKLFPQEIPIARVFALWSCVISIREWRVNICAASCPNFNWIRLVDRRAEANVTMYKQDIRHRSFAEKVTYHLTNVTIILPSFFVNLI